MIAAKLHRNGHATVEQKRVAIYARQSVEDTQSEFGSIQAQREAVAAYVASQRAHGWSVLPTHYHDAGYSGGTVERPAFRALLTDVAAGRVDVVAVYKIDRLSRSIGDFVQLMALFEKHGVEFVSVTQQFSTTSSVGRLTLNLLITFAQFERETIAERTKDKMLAARRKGMWTGGPTPPGYRLEDHKLVVDPVAAERVRVLFLLFAQTGSVTRAIASAPEWKGYDKARMRRLLACPVYVGDLRAGDKIVRGQHEAIVERSVWDKAQARMVAREKPGPRPARSVALLAGVVWCACGAKMQVHRTRRHRRDYEYYVCTRSLKQGAAACSGPRVALGDLDKHVVEQFLSLASTPRMVESIVAGARKAFDERGPTIERELGELQVTRDRLENEHANVMDAIAGGGGRALLERLREVETQLAGLVDPEQRLEAELAGLRRTALDETAARAAAQRIATVWPDLWTDERRRVVQLLVERVDVRGDEVEVTIRPRGLVEA